MASRRKRGNGGGKRQGEKDEEVASSPKGSLDPPATAPPPVTPVAPPSKPKLAAQGATDVGRKRDNNQDAYLVDEEFQLYIVADGMGGHAGGGTASRVAVETIQERIHLARVEQAGRFAASTSLADSPLPEVMREAIEAACFAIYRQSKANRALAGMGTTATALLVHGPHAFIGHVGDSRVYLVRDGEIHQLSEDHSLVNEQIKAGVLTPEEARHSQFKNVITRSVGFEEDVLVDLLGVGLAPGDTFVVCCDGLSNMVHDEEIKSLVTTEPLEDLPTRLIALANARGGDDNITVVAVRVEAL